MSTVERPSGIDVVALTPEWRDDLVTFLGEDGFVDNPDWADCYCQWPFESPLGSEQTVAANVGEEADVDAELGYAAANRALACRRIDARVMTGHVALRDGRIIGWCAAGPRQRYAQLGDILTDGDHGIGAIMCFVVGPDARGQGVGPALLAAAVRAFRDEGLKIAESYPRRDAVSQARKFHGSVDMYLAAGFRVHREREDGTTVMRLSLAADGAGTPDM